MTDEFKERFPNLSNLSLALIEHLIEAFLGPDTIKVLKKPYEVSMLRKKLEEVLSRTEERWLYLIDKKNLGNFAKVFRQLPISDLPKFKEAVYFFYRKPTDPTLPNLLRSQISKDLGKEIPDSQIEILVDIFIQSLQLEIFDSIPEFRSTISSLLDFQQLEILKDILKRMNSFSEYIELSSEIEEEIKIIYREELKKSTSKLPWVYALSSLSSDIDISQIYYFPSFSLHDQKKSTLIIVNERQEREIERRDKKTLTYMEEDQAKIDLNVLLGSENPIAVLGYMGSGKSLTANYIAWLSTQGDLYQKFGWKNSKLPIIVELGNYSLVNEAGNFIDMIFEIASCHFPKSERMRISHVLRKEWKAGNIILILDALDEYLGSSELIKRQLEYLVESIPTGCHLILTSRPSAYKLINPKGFATYDLNEIDSKNLGNFVIKWVNALYKISDRPEINPETHTSALVYQILDHKYVETIVSNPLLLTILIILSLSSSGVDLGKIENETELFNQFIDYIIERQKYKPGLEANEISSTLLRITLGYSGLLVHSNNCDQKPVKSTYIREVLAKSKYFKNIANGLLFVDKALDFWIKTGVIIEDDNIKRNSLPS